MRVPKVTKFEPIPEWKKTLKHAWSVRYIALGFFLTGAEAVINTMGIDFLPIPQWARLSIIMLVNGLAFYYRFKLQPKMRND
jgi:hypothetical protein